MNAPDPTPCPALKDRFTWYEKLIARGCIIGAVLTGAAAMFLASPILGMGYLAAVALGGAVVVYDALCVYCPYPYSYSDCLFYPYQLVAQLTSLRSGPIPVARKAAAALAFGVIFAVPQYWLWGNWVLFALFWAFIVPLAVMIPLYLCRRCRHQRCPMNRAAI